MVLVLCYHEFSIFIHFSTTKKFIDCEIIAIPGKYDYKLLAYGYQLNSPYAGALDYHIKLIRENGGVDQVITKYQGGRQNCPDLRLRKFSSNYKYCKFASRYDIVMYLGH